MVKKISQDEFNSEVANGLAIVDFSAEWCGPCKMLAPVLEQVSEELSGQAKFFNVDTDENPDLAREYRIMNIPAIVVLKDGKAIGMEVGFKPKDLMLEALKKYL